MRLKKKQKCKWVFLSFRPYFHTSQTFSQEPRVSSRLLVSSLRLLRLFLSSSAIRTVCVSSEGTAGRCWFYLELCLLPAVFSLSHRWAISCLLLSYKRSGSAWGPQPCGCPLFLGAFSSCPQGVPDAPSCSSLLDVVLGLVQNHSGLVPKEQSAPQS